METTNEGLGTYVTIVIRIVVVMNSNNYGDDSCNSIFIRNGDLSMPTTTTVDEPILKSF